MRRLLLLVATSLTMAAGASAADLPRTDQPRAYYSDAPAWTWTGFYLGLNGGYGFSTSSNQLALSGDQPTGLYSTGGFGGGQIGYNLQISQWVFGVEADFQDSRVRLLLAGELRRRVHQRDMGEGLGEVAHQPAGHRVVLLGEQTEVVAQSEQSVEQLAGVAVASQHGEAVG